MKQSTRYFKNCLGVFQGGGCKALSFVGAYKESVERGVFFSGVAGTSAGSVIAALIAAGATPEYLEEIVLKTNFNSFKHSPDLAIKSDSGGWESGILSLGTAKHRSIACFMKNLGIFSSAKIEEWIEEHLRTLLEISDSQTVTFASLNIPLHIVATEIGGTKPVVWSSETTPEASVAYAVRCSCTIPVYFQPVDYKYVDGGIVSNLPSFVLNNNHSGSFEKILCFTFESGIPSVDTKTNDSGLSSYRDRGISIQQYLKDLIAATIDGSVYIQTELQKNLHVIEIGGLPLGTVDFDKINGASVQAMFDAGAKATEDFFSSEITNIRGNRHLRSILATEPEALNHIVREEVSKGDEVVFSLKSTRYVYKIFPSLLCWRMHGARLVFLTHPVRTDLQPEKQHHELFRRLVLKGLGASIVEVNSLPFEAVLFRKQGLPGTTIVFDETRKDGRSACFGVRYERAYDSVAINSMYCELTKHFGELPKTPDKLSSAIEISQGGVDDLFKRLGSVELYVGNRVRLGIEEVDVQRIVFLSKYVKSYKYHQIQRLFDVYKLRDIETFESAMITYRVDGKEVMMPITPPVAEEHGGMLYLLEGNSRLTYLIKEKKAKRVKLVVVRNVAGHLPTTGRFNARQLLISDEDRIGDDRYEEFDYSAYRNIEEAVRNPVIYKEYY